MNLKLKNFTIKKFNLDVNFSEGADEKYARWTDYRKWTSSIIERALKADTNIKNALVLGAGNLNDLDLRLLCINLDSLVLTDVSAKSIEEGVKRQGIEIKDAEKIKIIEADYTGADEEKLFDRLERLAAKVAPADKIIECINEVMEGISDYRPNIPSGFDLVISCPVYTQLIYTQMEVFLRILYEQGLYEYNQLNKILNAVYNLMPDVIKRYSDLVLNSCKKGGLVIMLSDMIEFEKGSGLSKKAKEASGLYCTNHKKAEKLVEKYGIELAQTGCEDFISKTHIIASDCEIWDFNESKGYLVCGYLAEKR